MNTFVIARTYFTPQEIEQMRADQPERLYSVTFEIPQRKPEKLETSPPVTLAKVMESRGRHVIGFRCEARDRYVAQMVERGLREQRQRELNPPRQRITNGLNIGGVFVPIDEDKA